MTARATMTMMRRNQNRTRRRADARLRLNSFRINRDDTSRSQKGKLVRPFSLAFSFNRVHSRTFNMSRHYEKGILSLLRLVIFLFCQFSYHPFFPPRLTSFPPSPEHKYSCSSSRKLVWFIPLPLQSYSLWSPSRRARTSSRLV